MMDFPILSIMLCIPLFTALYILLFVTQSIREDKTIYIKYIAVLSGIFSLITSIAVALKFDRRGDTFQFVERIQWVESIGLEYHIGLDGVSLLFVILTTLLTLICIIISLFTITKNVKEYLVCFLLMEFLTLGFFCSMNLLLFYVFFETLLIPMYIIIGTWGGERRIYAALKFFLYTFFGSVFFLVALVFIYQMTGTFDMELLIPSLRHIPFNTSQILWIGVFIAFAVKVPMFPFHTWLPDAHVEAPTAGSVILAGILLKVGGYGFFRVLIPMLPEASVFFAPYVILLSVVAIIYASLVALAQTNMKKMIAYSSIAHMGYVTAGMFSFTKIGAEGAIFQMISHGLVSSGLFLAVGVLYERHHTKDIEAYGCVASRMPIFASILMIYVLGSVGLPGTSGFIGEFFSLVGLFNNFPYASVLGASGVILGALYMLKLYRKIMLGEMKHPEIALFKDLSITEIIALLPLAILVIYLGLYPKAVMQFIHLPGYFV
ncbi:MAG: NADH-quinone oxidoreductase subunit M [Pseudomonadota bacterium]